MSVHRRRAVFNQKSKEISGTKIWAGKTLNKFGALTTDLGGYTTDFIPLPGLHNKNDLTVFTGLTHPNYMNPAQDPLSIRCVVFYDSQKRLIYTQGMYDDPMPPSYYTLDRSRTISSSILANLLNKAGDNVPLYVRMSIINPGQEYIQQNNTLGLTAHYSTNGPYVFVDEPQETHTVTVSTNGVVAPPINGYPIPHGQPLTIGFTHQPAARVYVYINQLLVETNEITITNTVYTNKPVTILEIPSVEQELVIYATDAIK